ncbi:DUF2194 domain-containing protein [Paenibacillus sp. 481]|uniref:DUF2194 domain-containing protein n=1 Tax=Paenibacillus sp. 481 TaxID=2835869 RepID=UPI001E55F627|nr:DUF2194 domain-containing protein [Paenibacillus sp. 481]UHA75200.1 DUF2194 domain-containing protein [Paenibacillus sp. 481]
MQRQENQQGEQQNNRRDEQQQDEQNQNRQNEQRQNQHEHSQGVNPNERQLTKLDKSRGHVQRASIIFMLAIVLILGGVLQFSRSQSLEHIGSVQQVEQAIANVKWQSLSLTADKKATFNTQRLAIAYDQQDEQSMRLTRNIERVLTDMKWAHDLVDVNKLKVGSTVNDYYGVVLTKPDLSTLPDSDWIEHYVTSGGRLLFAVVPTVDGEFYSVYRKLGINDMGGHIQTSGIRIETDFMLGAKGASFKGDSLTNVSLSVTLEDDVAVHVKSEQGVPLLWETALGKGKIVVFNGSILQEKTSRGLAGSAIGLLADTYAYPVINAKVIYLDDFPAPLPIGINESLFETYRRSLQRFFKEVWWPDMIRLAAKHDLRYTGAVIQSYDNDVTPPFEQASSAETTHLLSFGHELLKNKGEIAIHGYNHQSLSTNLKKSAFFGYKPWPNESSMEQSIKEVNKYVEGAFPGIHLHTYVPPSNVLTPEGRAALKQAWPKIGVISSVFAEDQNKNAYVQEFGVAADGIIELPRMTAGFTQSEYNNWIMMNAASYLGVFSHFVHPDDVLDERRSGSYSWSQMYKNLSAYLSMQESHYGWLRPMTAAGASHETLKWAKADVTLDYKQQGVNGYVNQFGGELQFILRTDQRITNQRNCKVTPLGQSAYLVKVAAPEFSIQWGGQ